ncbi:MAG TPA: hypothetical protein VIL47_04935, partial [Candidatus Bipolaricaulota bacterium]
QVSLDPLPHIRREPMGMIGVPLLTFFLNDGQWMMGWASAPYNRLWALDFPKRASVMALAGPLANLIFVLLSGAALKIGLISGTFEYPDPEKFGLTGSTHSFCSEPLTSPTASPPATPSIWLPA